MPFNKHVGYTNIDQYNTNSTSSIWQYVKFTMSTIKLTKKKKVIDLDFTMHQLQQPREIDSNVID